MNHRPLIAVVVGLLVASCSPSDHTKPIASAAPEVDQQGVIWFENPGAP